MSVNVHTSVFVHPPIYNERDPRHPEVIHDNSCTIVKVGECECAIFFESLSDLREFANHLLFRVKQIEEALAEAKK